MPVLARRLNRRAASQIRTALRRGETGVSIAKRFVCSAHTVSLIKRGKIWVEARRIDPKDPRVVNRPKNYDRLLANARRALTN